MVVATAFSAAVTLVTVAASAAVVVTPSVHAAVSSAAVAALSTHVDGATTSSVIRVTGHNDTFTKLVAALVVAMVIVPVVANTYTALSVTLMTLVVLTLVLLQLGQLATGFIFQPLKLHELRHLLDGHLDQVMTSCPGSSSMKFCKHHVIPLYLFNFSRFA